MTPLATAAAEYAKRGFLVLPLYGVYDRGDGVYICNCRKGARCKSPGKHPTLRYEYATRDPELAAKRQEAVPKWNLCTILDDQIDVTVLDFDGEDGRRTKIQIEESFGPLPETWAQATGRASGGEHLFYRVPRHLNYYAIRNRKIAPGLDVKGENGLVVLAPSLHRDGKRYRLQNDLPIATLPDWLYRLIVSDTQRRQVVQPSDARPTESELERDGYPLARRIELARDKLTERAKREPAIQGQNGSRACLRAAILLVRGYCLPPDEAFTLLWKIYNPVCIPPWSESELMHKIESAEFHARQAGWRFMISNVGGSTVDALIAQARGEKPRKRKPSGGSAEAAKYWMADETSLPNPLAQLIEPKPTTKVA